jgi:ubiquitin-protein ligase
MTATNPPESVIARTAISLEYASLRHAGHCPLGMYVVPSTASLFVWDAAFFVHQGYYADAILKFNLTFPPNYPERPPAVQFVTDIFHPLISQDGTFSLSPRFRPWRPKEHHVFDVLHWVKAAFKKHALDQIKADDCSNKEAYRLYHESTQSFAALAVQSASLSQSESALFDTDHPSLVGKVFNEITFHKLSPDELRRQQGKLGVGGWDDKKPSVSA